MCYSKPRPRCSGHAKEALKKATTAHVSNPTPVTAAALREAERDFAITPEGIKQVRAAASKAIDEGAYKRSALLSRDADNRESLRELLSEAVENGDTSPTDYIPYVVTAHPDPAFAYDFFEKDASKSVRVALVEGDETPIPVLDKLTTDEDEYVRACAAANERTSGEALTALVWNERPNTLSHREALTNPSLPATTVIHVAVDPDIPVAIRRFHPSTPPAVAHAITQQFSSESLADVDDETLTGLLEGTQKVDLSVLEMPSPGMPDGWKAKILLETRDNIQAEVLNRSALASRLLGVPNDESTAQLLRDHPSQVKSMLGWV